MAASPGTELVSPASPPTTTSSQTSHLKAYPYLFVRETDQVEDWIDAKSCVTTLSHPQTDYFCTVCEESLKEEELQSHLFDGHSAENLQVE